MSIAVTIPGQAPSDPNSRALLALPGRNGRIAFLRASPTFGLYTMSPNGSKVKRLRALPIDASSPPFPPVWLPAGRAIAFGAKERLYLVAGDGSNLRRLFPNRLIASPAWSPDGRLIAYVQGRKEGADTLYGQDGLHMMRSDGTQARLLVRTDWVASPVWAPGGRRIAFSGQGIIHVVNADGTELRRLTMAEDVFDRHPNWSPDGSKIVFSRHDGEGSEIYLVNATGTELKRLTSSTDGSWSEQPAWSPDGTKIAFASNRRLPDFSDIYLMNPDGTAQQRLTRNKSFSYAPAWQRLPR